MGTLERGLSTVRAHPEAGRFAGPCSEKAVARAERALRLRFPPSYRRFLLELGGGSIGGCDFYGVVGNADAPDAIATTLAERSRRRLPSGLLVVGRPPDDGWYVLDCGAVRGGEEAPVLAWAPGAGAWVAASFGEFFGTLVAESLGPRR